MKALTVIPLTKGRPGSTTSTSRPRADGPVLVETLAVGVCGTDVEIISGAYGWAPPGHERLVLGHESLGRVLEAPAGRAVAAGDLVVGIVRRPDPVPCAQLRRRRVGLLPQRPVHRARHQGARRLLLRALPASPEFVVKVDAALGELGVLLEPTSVVAKAWEQVERIGGRAHWEPKTAVVTGAGPIGLLAALIGVQRGLEVHVIDQVTAGVKPELVAALGATYHTGPIEPSGTAPDVVIECTGVGSARLRRHGAVAPGGVVCLDRRLVGRPVDRRSTPACSTASMVLENEAVVGSVNANRRHYEAAAAALAKADRAWLARLVSRRVPLDDWPQAPRASPTT